MKSLDRLRHFKQNKELCYQIWLKYCAWTDKEWLDDFLDTLEPLDLTNILIDGCYTLQTLSRKAEADILSPKMANLIRYN